MHPQIKGSKLFGRHDQVYRGQDNHASNKSASFRDHTTRLTTKMPKRKRGEDELEEKLVFHRAELWRQIKAAKGFERQRMAKRQRDPKSTAEKRARIDKEIAVLKVWYTFL